MHVGTKRVGRPPSYDRDKALAALRDLFWRQGFAATSLEEVSVATGMNRPSLYAAFGDKRAMYRTAFGAFAADVRAGAQKALDRPTLAEALSAFYDQAIQLYIAGPSPRGCMAACVAVLEAHGDETVRGDLLALLGDLDATLAQRFAAAREAGEVMPEVADEAVARMATAVLHSLAIRARAGTPRACLDALASAAVRLLTGQAGPAR